MTQHNPANGNSMDVSRCIIVKNHIPIAPHKSLVVAHVRFKRQHLAKQQNNVSKRQKHEKRNDMTILSSNAFDICANKTKTRTAKQFLVH